MNAEQISALSDDELYAKLQEMGGVVGPIVDSTRNLYERCLFKKLHGTSLVCESSHESGSEEEPDVRNYDDVITSHTVRSSSQSAYGTKVEFRHRPFKSYGEAHDGIYFDRTSLARGSYRSGLQNTPAVTKFQYTNKGKYPTPSSKQPRMPVALLAVVAVVVILALVYFNMESSSKSPIPNLPRY